MEEGHEETEGGGATWNVAVSRSANDGLPSTYLCHSVTGTGLNGSAPSITRVYTYHSVSYSRITL